MERPQQLLVALAALLSAAPLVAQGPDASAPETAADAQDGPSLRVEDAEGNAIRRPLADLSIEDAGDLGGVLVRVVGVEPAETPDLGAARAVLRLRDGGRVAGELLGGEGERVDLELVGGSRLRVRIDELDSLRFPGRLPATGRVVLEPAELGDRLYRTAGEDELDRIDGAVEAFELEGLRFASDLGSKLVPWNEVAALFVEALDDTVPTAEGTPVVVDLVDGSRLHAGFLRWNEERLELETPSGRGLAIPSAAVAELFVDDGRLRFLSDLEPVSVEEPSPFGDELGLTWPHRMDRSVTGGPLTAGGRRWSRGIGVHAPSRLGFRLEDDWKELRGAVAIDDEVLRLSARGSVVFRVLIDGGERWESDVVRGGEPPVRMPRIDLEGAEELVLEVDVATDLHVADRADWLGIVLVR